MESTSSEAIPTLRQGPRGAKCLRGHFFQFIPTKGSVLTFFFPGSECIGNHTLNCWIVLTVYKFNTLPLYKKIMMMVRFL